MAETTLKIPAASLKEVPESGGGEASDLRKTIVPLSGKLITAEDPLTVGRNFVQLDNMEYTDAAPKSIGGMTKINTSVMDATYLKTRNAHHFRKIQPGESPVIENHILAQAWNTGLTASHVLQNVTAPPAAGAFEATDVWTDTAGAGVGRFSDAPGGKVAYCNGKDTCLWGGNGIPCTGFITSTADVTDTPTNPMDYTDAMQNTRTDAENVAIIGGGNDSYTVLLLHGDGADAATTITDSSVGGGGAPPKTVVADNDAQIDTAQVKFGTGSILFDGTDDFIHVDSTDPDINDFYMGTGTFTIDFWVRIADTSADTGLFNQYVDADNYVSFYCEAITVLGVPTSWFKFNIRSGASDTVAISAPFPRLSSNTWYHISVIRGWGGAANAWIIALDGEAGTSVTTDADPWPDLNADFEIGRNQGTSADYLNGWIDEFRVSKGTARWTADFSPPTRAYSAAARYWLVRSPLPIQGGKIYVSGANYVTSTLAIKEWNGYSWQAKTVTDNTSAGGVSLAQTGTFSFTSTVTTSKPKIIEGGFGYWYLFSLSAGEAEIYYMTLDCPFQQIQDIWDGIDRTVSAFFKYTTVYTDYTLNVREDYYDTADATSYADLGGLAAYSAGNNCILLGFFDRLAAINIGVPSDKVNATAGTLSLDYWNGSDFVEVGHAVDGTAESGAPLAKPGTVSFTIPDPWNVFKRTVANNAVPLYYYRVRSTGALTAGTAIYYVSGIAAPKQIRGYKFPLFSQDRLMLCCNMDGKRNSVLVSVSDTSQVFNGDTSYELEFGTSGELNCGCSLFSQYGSNLFNLTLFFKDSEIWNLVWNGTTWVKYCISQTIGCPADLTLDTVIIPPVEGQQGNRSLAIWEGADGVYISEGRHPVCVSHDIRDLWDQNATTHINQSYQKSHYGKVDQAKLQYHLIVATTTGAVTTLDDEWVLDLRRWKWFHASRATGRKLQVIIDVLDAYGIHHSYGFLDTGYMERLEYGNTFDGSAIVSTWKLGDSPLGEFPEEHEVKAVVPVLKAKNTTTNDATLTHYIDTAATGTDYTVDPTDATHRLAIVVKTANSTPGVLHSFKMTMTTSDEVSGLEPFLLAIYHQKIREKNYE